MVRVRSSIMGTTGAKRTLTALPQVTVPLLPSPVTCATLVFPGGTVLTVQRRVCDYCKRTIYEQGRARIIEAARLSAGTEPVEELLGRLEDSKHSRDRRRLADVAILLEEYAREGTLERPRELNHLRAELREIKAGDVRLTFYEFIDQVHSVRVTRLTTGFIKRQQRTSRREIDRGLWVIREDRRA